MLRNITVARAAAEALVSTWQAHLGEKIKVGLGGSLMSGLFVWDDQTEVIDVDVRFLVDDEQVFDAEIRERIESVTGLKLRKQITVSNEPDETPSTGLLLEGRFTVPGVSVPLEVEGLLRNRRYASWAHLYPTVFTQDELREFLRMKRALKAAGDRAAYKAYKSEIRREADRRIVSRGLAKLPSAA